LACSLKYTKVWVNKWFETKQSVGLPKVSTNSNDFLASWDECTSRHYFVKEETKQIR
jgi:hypothetical protein